MNDWRPNCGAETARQRALLLERARRWFADAGVLEVDTPALCAATVTDPHIASLTTSTGSYLHTSPEFAMKRLLAAGYPDIYFIGKVFRDDEISRLHLSEFTMIEWYRRDFGLDAIVADTLSLIAALLDRPALTDNASDLDYRDAFLKHAGVDPLTAQPQELAAAADADTDLAASLGDDRDAWLDLLMGANIGPELGQDGLTVVRHYPASQAALARVCPADPARADRFEVFYKGVELANGYVELTDTAEQAARMDRDLETRKRLALPAPRRDEQLLAALSAGLPPCAGVALGFERLHMLYVDASDIRDVVTFS